MLADANISNERAERMWNRCIQRCEDITGPHPDDPINPPDDPATPCPGGYKPKLIDGVQVVPCKESFVPFTAPDGGKWCCPPPDDPEDDGVPCQGGYKARVVNGKIAPCDAGYIPTTTPNGDRWCCPQGGPDDPDTPGGEDVPCEGGYLLANDPVEGGGGKIWTDSVIKASDGWYRDSKAQSHKIWHPDWGFQQLEDVYAYIQGKGDLTPNKGSACKKGYKKTNINGEEWCCPGAEGGGGGDGLGYFQWPDELMNLYRSLAQRGTDLLGKEPGFSDEAIRTMFGRDYDKVRQTGDLSRERVMNQLQTEGLAGTGTSQDVGMDTAWQTERALNDVMENVFLANEEQKREDLNLYTTLANMILGSGSGFIAGGEAINAGRRGEQQNSLQMLMQFLQMLLGSYAQ